MKKSSIFSLIAFILAFAFILANTTPVQAETYHIAKICKDCYKNQHGKTQCVKCGSSSSDRTSAKICSSCQNTKCVKCGVKPYDSNHRAYICKDCLKSLKHNRNKDVCIKCGK